MSEVKVKEFYSHWLPPLLKASAVTIGSNIYYGMQEYGVWSQLRAHEMKHVEQYKKYTVPGFLLIYTYEYILGRLKGKDHWKAYEDISFEVEARAVEKLVPKVKRSKKVTV